MFIAALCAVSLFACAPKTPLTETYTVTFNANTGVFSDGTSVTTQTVESGKKVTSPAVSRDGYDFTGWFTDLAATVKADLAQYVITSDITFYAGWTVKQADDEQDPPPAEEPTLSSITVTPPTKTQYVVGQTVSYDGLKVTARYSDDTTEEITSGYTVSTEAANIDTSAKGTTTVTVTYEGKTATFTVTVVEKKVTGLSHTGSLTGKFALGDPFNMSKAGGLIFTVTYNDGSTAPVVSGVTFESAAIVGGKFTVAGTATIIAKYGDVTDPTPIQVEVVEVTKYDVIYNANLPKYVDSNSVKDMPEIERVEENKKATEPVLRPSIKGYEFADKWTTDPEGTSPFAFGSTPITTRTTLYAQWTPKSYNVVYDLDNGSYKAGESNSLSYTATNNAFEPYTLKAPEKAHYVWDGWYTQKTGGEKREAITYADVVAAPSNTINLYARFTPETYTVEYKFGGSAATYEAEKKVTTAECWKASYTYGDSFDLPVEGDIKITSKDGQTYHFLGWYLEGDVNETRVTKVNATDFDNKVFVANIKAVNVYTITVHPENGENNSTVKVQENLAIGTLQDPERLGYSFAGWYTSTNYAVGEEWDIANKKVTADDDIYAKWGENTYNIAYDLDALDGATNPAANSATYKITNGEKTLQSPENIAAGYYFVGWFTESVGGTKVEKLNGDFITGKENGSTTTLYARFSNKYSVTFEQNAGSDTVTNMPDDQPEVTYGAELDAVRTPVRENYTFGGWYTDSDCTEANKWVFKGEDGTVSKIDGNVSLYAKWTENADDGWYLLKNGMTAADLTAANCASYKMTVDGNKITAAGLTLAVNDTFIIVEYVKSNAAVTEHNNYTIEVTPAGAITVTADGEYKVTAIDATLTTPTFTLETDNTTATLKVTLDGYFDQRGMNGAAASLTTVSSEDKETDVAYIIGNFTGDKRTAEWSSANAVKVGDVIYFQNVSLKKFDKFNVEYNGKNSQVQNITAAGAYNISYNTVTEGITVEEYKALTAVKKTGEANNVYVGQTIGESKITVTYDGNEINIATAEAPDGYTLVTSATTSSVADESSFTVIYKGSVVTVTFTAVAVAATGIEAELPQEYLAANYYYGDDVQSLKEHMTVRVLYNDGHKDAYIGEYTLALVIGTAATGEGVKPTDKLNGGRLTIAATVEGSERTTTIELENTYNKITSLDATYSGGAFKEDDTFTLGEDNANLTVTAYFNGGTSTSMALAKEEYSLDLEVGSKLVLPESGNTQTVTVTVKNDYTDAAGVTARFDITVNKKVLTSIERKGELTKAEYLVGETFDISGVTVTANFDNNTTADVTDSVAIEFNGSTIEDNFFTTADTYRTLTFKYTFDGVEKTVAYSVEIKVSNRLTSIDVTTPTAGREVGFVEGDAIPQITFVTRKYNEGITGATQTSDTTNEGITVVIKKDGAVVDMTATPMPTLEVGKYEYTVTYDGLEKKVSIDVIAKVVTDISADVSGLATQYTNAPFNPTGLVINAVYNNGDNVVIPNDEYTFTVTEGYGDNGGFMSAGTKTMTATHKTDSTKNTTFTITVVAETRFSITYVATNGNYTVTGVHDVQTVQTGVTLDKPADPVCKGFTLEGWYWTKNGVESKWVFNDEATAEKPATVVAGNRTLVAKWVSKSYNINYCDYEDSALSAADKFEATDNVFGELTLKGISNFPTLTVPANKQFDGWALTKDATVGIMKFTYDDLPAADNSKTINIYPVFTAIKYDVTFDLNYTGAPAMDKDRVEHGGTVAKPEDPKRDYYTFGGWYKDKACGDANKWVFAGETGTANTIDGVTTLYAKWTPITYTVKFTVNAATADAIADAKVAVEAGTGVTAIDKYALPTPTVKTGVNKRFAGWKLGGKTVTAITLADFAEGTEITLTAEFTDITYITVKFNYNYEGAPAEKTVSVEKGTKITEAQLTSVAPADRTGFSFVGWYEEESGDTEWNKGDNLNADVTVYAKWSDVKYTVTFNATKPTGASATVKNAPASVEIAQGGKVTEPATAPSLTGYVFDGWYKDSALKTKWNFDTDTVTKATTIYAKWTARDGIYVGDTFKKAYVDVTENVEVKASFVQLAAGEKFNSYRGGKMVDMYKLKTGTNSAAANFEISTDHKTVTVKAGKGGVYNISLNYSGDTGLWITYEGEKFEEAQLKPNDGIYVDGAKKAGFIVNADGMNELQALKVEIGNGATDHKTYKITVRYAGATTDATLAAVGGNGSGAGDGITATFTTTSVTLYAGTYDFYYMYEATASSAKNKLWVNGTQKGGPEVVQEDYYVVGTINGASKWDSKEYKFEYVAANSNPFDATYKYVLTVNSSGATIKARQFDSTWCDNYGYCGSIFDSVKYADDYAVWTEGSDIKLRANDTYTIYLKPAGTNGKDSKLYIVPKSISVTVTFSGSKTALFIFDGMSSATNIHMFGTGVGTSWPGAAINATTRTATVSADIGAITGIIVTGAGESKLSGSNDLLVGNIPDKKLTAGGCYKLYPISAASSTETPGIYRWK